MKDDRVYLRHILDAIRQINEYTRDGEQAFFRDRKTQDAVLRNIQIIGEAAKLVSPALKEGHPDVPWKQIAGMRDKVIHDYFGINLRLVWDTVRGSMQELNRRASVILREIDPQGTLPNL